VGYVDLSVSALRATCSPIYVPAYVLSRRARDAKIRTLVSGCVPGAVAGTQLYDPWRVAAAAAAAGAALSALLFGGVSLTSVAAPALAAVWLVQRAPKLAASLERWRVARERMAAAAGGGAGSAASWDAYGFVRGYADFEEAQREREEAAEEEAARERARRRASGGRQQQWQQQWKQRWQEQWQEEGQQQRGLALRHRPDRVPAAEKAAATARFQRLTAAYNVLRDPRRRRAYDETGRA